MSLIDDIKRDRDAGRGNQWRLIETLSSATVMDGTCEVLKYIQLDSRENRSNARRIARVPDMEAALLASEDLASTLDAITDKHWCNSVSMDEVVYVQDVLNTYRKTTGAT